MAQLGQGAQSDLRSTVVTTPARPKHLKPSKEFPKLRKIDNDVTSDRDPTYNCIAYAAGVTDRKYWPNYLPDFYWPPKILHTETIDAIVGLFESLGYTRCVDGAFTTGREKVAVFAMRNGTPTHAARQIGPDRWASKLGNSFDIEHATNAVSGGMYGSIVVYLERPVHGVAATGGAPQVPPTP